MWETVWKPGTPLGNLWRDPPEPCWGGPCCRALLPLSPPLTFRACLLGLSSLVTMPPKIPVWVCQWCETGDPFCQWTILGTCIFLFLRNQSTAPSLRLVFVAVTPLLVYSAMQYVAGVWRFNLKTEIDCYSVHQFSFKQLWNVDERWLSPTDAAVHAIFIRSLCRTIICQQT